MGRWCRCLQALLWLEWRKAVGDLRTVILPHVGATVAVLLLASVVVNTNLLRLRSDGTVTPLPETLSAACETDSVPHGRCRVGVDQPTFRSFLERRAGGDGDVVEFSTAREPALPIVAAATSAHPGARLLLWLQRTVVFSAGGGGWSGTPAVAAFLQSSHWLWSCGPDAAGAVAQGELPTDSDLSAGLTAYLVASVAAASPVRTAMCIARDKDERRRCILSANGAPLFAQLLATVAGAAAPNVVLLLTVSAVTLLPAGALHDGVWGLLLLAGVVAVALPAACLQAAAAAAAVRRKRYEHVPALVALAGGWMLAGSALLQPTPAVISAVVFLAPFSGVVIGAATVLGGLDASVAAIECSVLAAAAAAVVWSLVMLWAHSVWPGRYGVPKRVCAPWRARRMWPVRRGEGPAADPDCFEDAGRDSAEAVVRLEHLYKCYNHQVSNSREPGQLRRSAVDDLCLLAYRQETLALLGPNGAGKSTLLDVVSGICAPTWADHASCMGHSLLESREKVQAGLGVCLQRDTVWESLSVRDHVMLFAMLRASEGDAGAVAARIMEELQLTADADKPAGHLSGGMRRRLCVACALCSSAELLLLDEPSAGLDPTARRSLWSLLSGRRATGCSVLLSTHFTEEAEVLADRVAVMQRGRLTHHASLLGLRANAGVAYHLTLTCSEADGDAVQRAMPPAGGASSSQGMRRLEFDLKESDRARFGGWLRAAQSAGAAVAGLTVTTLEDAYLAIIRDNDDRWRRAEAEAAGDTDDAARQYWQSLCTRTRLAPSTEPMSTEDVMYALSAAPVNQSILSQMGLFLWIRGRVTMRNPADALVQLLSGWSAVFCAVVLVQASMTLRPPWRPGSEVNVLMVGDNLSAWTDRLDRVSDDTALSWATAPTLAEAATYNTPALDSGMSGLPTGGFAVRPAVSVAKIAALTNRFAPGSKQQVGTWLRHIAFTAATEGTCSRLPMPEMLAASWATMHVNYRIIAWGCCAAVLLTLLLAAVDLHQEVHGGTTDVLRAHGMMPAAYLLSMAAVLFIVTACATVPSLALSSAALNSFEAGSWGVIAPVLVSAAAACSLQVAALLGLLGRLVGSGIFLAVLGTVSVVQYDVPIGGLFMLKRLGAVDDSDALGRVAHLATPYGCIIEAFEILQAAHPGNAKFPHAPLQGDGVRALFAACCGHVLIGILLCAAASRWGLRTKDDVRAVCVCCREPPVAEGDELGPLDEVTDVGAVAEERPDTPAVVAASGVWSLYPPSKRTPEQAAPDSDIELGCRADTGERLAAVPKPDSGGKPRGGVRQLSLRLKGGEPLALLGPNGAGKSTLVNLLLGNRRPQRGHVGWFGGTPAHHCTALPQRRIGRQDQGGALWEHLSAEEHILALARLRVGSDVLRPRLRASLLWRAAVGLELVGSTTKQSSELSGGTKRKVCCAVALFSGADSLFLDEPSTGLDPGARCSLWEMLSAQHEAGRRLPEVRRQARATLLTTHQVEEADALAGRIAGTRVGFLSSGRIRCLGTPADLRVRYGAAYVLCVDAAGAPEGTDPSGQLLAALCSVCEGSSTCELCKGSQNAMLHFELGTAPPLADLFDWFSGGEATRIGVRHFTLAQPSSLSQMYLRFADEAGEQAAPEP